MILVVLSILLFLLFYLQKKLYEKYWNKNLSIDINFSPNRIIEGNDVELIESIKNEKSFPLSSLHINFTTSKYLIFDDSLDTNHLDNYYRNDIFSIPANSKITRVLKIKTTKRGYYKINSIHLVTNDYFLSKSFIDDKTNNGYLFVYPSIIPNKEIPFPIDKIIGDYISKNSIYLDPFAFKGIRNYQPYDNMSSINWKVSAKNNTLMVNEYSSTSSLNIELLLNTELPNFQNDLLGEFAIKIIATLSDKVSKLAIPYSFVTNGSDIITNDNIKIASSTGLTQHNKINEALTKIDLSKKTIDFNTLLKNSTNNSSLKIIISSDYRNEILKTYTELKRQNNNIIFIIPTYNHRLITIKHDKNIIIWEVN